MVSLMFSWPRVESRRKLSQTSSAVSCRAIGEFRFRPQLEDQALAVRRQIGGFGHQAVNRIRLVHGPRHERVEHQLQSLGSIALEDVAVEAVEGAGDRVSAGIAQERRLLEELKGEADVVVDTSDLNVHELRDRLRELFDDPTHHRRRAADQHRVVRVQARAAPRRRPRVRLPVPAQPALGRRAAPAHRHRRRRCATTCSGSRRPLPFLDELERLFALLLPAYVREGKSYLSIGIGCTGGRHRSVVIAEELARGSSSSSAYPPSVHHRDVERE